MKQLGLQCKISRYSTRDDFHFKVDIKSVKLQRRVVADEYVTRKSCVVGLKFHKELIFQNYVPQKLMLHGKLIDFLRISETILHFEMKQNIETFEILRLSFNLLN